MDVTHFVPDQTFGIQSPTLRAVFTVEPVELGTRLNTHFEVEATGLMTLMYKWILKRFVMSDLHNFKKTVESTQVARV